MGSVWEILEFSLDLFYGFNLQNADLRDTMGDLIMNAAGGLFVAVAGFSYMRNGHMKLVSGYLEKLIKKNPKLFSARSHLEQSSDYIASIINKGESASLEFKSTMRTNLHTHEQDSRIEHATLKTLVAFMNTGGGTLLIGVGDTGLVHGLENDRFPSNDSLRLHFTNLIKHKIGNEFLPFIEFELFPVRDKHVLKVECHRSTKPVFLKHDQDEEFYIRNGPASVKLTSRELIDYIGNHFDN